jgi:hypothetical protein
MSENEGVTDIKLELAPSTRCRRRAHTRGGVWRRGGVPCGDSASSAVAFCLAVQVELFACSYSRSVRVYIDSPCARSACAAQCASNDGPTILAPRLGRTHRRSVHAPETRDGERGKTTKMCMGQ